MIQIDCDFPGGNVLFDGIEGDTVRVRQDQRDTFEYGWFYWYFRVRGAAVVLFLGLMRLRFWWWPLHPLGYIAANTWGAQWWYMPFLVGWACKTLVIRHGGLRLYRLTVPLAIGLIVGDMANVGVWTLVALATGGRV